MLLSTPPLQPTHASRRELEAALQREWPPPLSLDVEFAVLTPDRAARRPRKSVPASVAVVGAAEGVLFERHIRPKPLYASWHWCGGVRLPGSGSSTGSRGQRGLTALPGARPDSGEPGAEALEAVRAGLAAVLRGRALVGHGLCQDLAALGLFHPAVRDTALVPRLRTRGGSRKLRDLARELLGLHIQPPGRPHSAAEDALAALGVYQHCIRHAAHDLPYKLLLAWCSSGGLLASRTGQTAETQGGEAVLQ